MIAGLFIVGAILIGLSFSLRSRDIRSFAGTMFVVLGGAGLIGAILFYFVTVLSTSKPLGWGKSDEGIEVSCCSDPVYVMGYSDFIPTRQAPRGVASVTVIGDDKWHDTGLQVRSGYSCYLRSVSSFAPLTIDVGGTFLEVRQYPQPFYDFYTAGGTNPKTPNAERTITVNDTATIKIKTQTKQRILIDMYAR